MGRKVSGNGKNRKTGVAQLGRPAYGRRLLWGLFVLLLPWLLLSAAADVRAQDGEEPPFTEILGYQVNYGEADGEGGYYRILPKIELLHQDEGLWTRYRFFYPGGQCEEGFLKEPDSRKVWEGLDGDGLWRLELELVLPEPEASDREEEKPGGNVPGEEKPGGNEAGEDTTGGKGESIGEENKQGEEENPSGEEPDKGEENSVGEIEPSGEEDKPEGEGVPVYREEDLALWRHECQWAVDSRPPVMQVRSPKEVSGWTNQAVTVRAEASDLMSGIGELWAEAGGKRYVSQDGSDLFFQVGAQSVGGRPVRVRICAADRAGNRAETELPLLIDRTPPAVDIDGADDYQIVAGGIRLQFRGEESNGFQSLEARIRRQLPGSTDQETLVSGWTEAEGGRRAEVSLEQDGIYHAEIRAVDAAGNKSRTEKQVIIDRTAPVIHLPEKLDGSCLREFRLDLSDGVTATDLTTISCQAELDGKLYRSGARVTREGLHTLLVRAADAAGNQTERRVRFAIDRTAPRIRVLDVESGKEVESGAVFQEEAHLRIQVQSPGEILRSVRINGESQSLARNAASAFTFTLQDAKPYELQITAQDEAGNISTYECDIRIQEPASGTFLQRMTAPFRREEEKTEPVSTGESPSEKGGRTPEKVWKKRLFLPLIFVTGVWIAAIFIRRKMNGRKNRENNPKKRENA